MTDNNPLPCCPYCGGKMYEAGNSTYRWYMCPRCLSGSPRKIIDKNKTWRCWLRKPTDKEMATTPWREK